MVYVLQAATAVQTEFINNEKSKSVYHIHQVTRTLYMASNETA